VSNWRQPTPLEVGVLQQTQFDLEGRVAVLTKQL